MYKLVLKSEDFIERGNIVNVHFVKSPSIINARVLYIPNAEGDSWHLITKKGLVYVQMFERIELIRRK